MSEPVRNYHCKRSRQDLRAIVEFSRKLIYSLNGDSPSNIAFSERDDRVYFLGGTAKGEITIKYVDTKDARTITTDDVLKARALFEDSRSLGPDTLDDESSSSASTTTTTRQLTKEEQLLRERKRCSFNGITSFCLEPHVNRLVFSENSELFFFDDHKPTESSSNTEQPIFTSSKGKHF